ncbi:MAG TPA: 3-methyl-2-oxobutanoate hydroxymethyltransferase [Prevotellaceae bacterium]|nr:3-methyl-2-oxobutanoate hydroxymethyltransferase [Prevotellaceae bacterium]
MTKKLNLKSLQKMKREGTTISWITAYDLPFASAAENTGIDMILVGDSGGMVQLGYETTNPVSMDEMIVLAKSARRGAPSTFIVGDMPQGSYEISKEKAVENAMRFVKEAGCDAIKLEGGRRVIDKVKAIVDAGILVIGHLGLTPQSTSSFGGYNVQGKTLKSFDETMEDALALQEAGVMALLLEAMPSEPAGQIAKQLDIPVLGIGAGNEVDGQLIIMHDMTGFYQSFRPWFAKCYVPEVIHDFAAGLKEVDDMKQYGREHRKDGLFAIAEMAIAKYVEEVKSRQFPSAEYIYPIKEEQLAEIKQSKYWK